MNDYILHSSILQELWPRYYNIGHVDIDFVSLPRYAGVPTMDFRNDFSPIILANPKSQSLVWGIPDSDVNSTFSGLRSQWTMSFLCKYCNAANI